MTAMHDTVRIAWDEQPDSVQLAIIPLLQAGGDCIYDVTDTVLYLNGIPDGIYLASIRTKCTRNMYWSLWSDSTSITVDNTLSVAATPAHNVTLSPNPTGGTLTIRCAAEMTKVELYDMQGRLALSATPTGSEAILDLQPLPTGSYVAVITTSQGTATRKVEHVLVLRRIGANWCDDDCGELSVVEVFIMCFSLRQRRGSEPQAEHEQ